MKGVGVESDGKEGERDEREKGCGIGNICEVEPVLKSVDNATVNVTPSTCCFTFILAPGANDGEVVG